MGVILVIYNQIEGSRTRTGRSVVRVSGGHSSSDGSKRAAEGSRRTADLPKARMRNSPIEYQLRYAVLT